MPQVLAALHFLAFITFMLCEAATLQAAGKQQMACSDNDDFKLPYRLPFDFTFERFLSLDCIPTITRSNL